MLVNCGNYNLDNLGLSKVECPAPKRQIDCPAGLIFSNGKCVNNQHNWISSEPYIKNGRFMVTYTQVSKPTPAHYLSSIPYPLAPSVSPNARSVQEYLKQVEEDRKITEKEFIKN